MSVLLSLNITGKISDPLSLLQTQIVYSRFIKYIQRYLKYQHRRKNETKSAYNFRKRRFDSH